MDAFTKKLTTMFEQVEPEFRTATVARYRQSAQNSFDNWIKFLAGPEPERGRFYREAITPPNYVKSKRGSYTPIWSCMVKMAEDGEWSCDLNRAESDANASVSYAKEHFIGKQAKKLANATKQRTDKPRLEGALSFNGIVVTGTLTAKYKNGDKFSVTLDMIVNHRYERGYTSFYQYPCRFTSVEMAGEPVKARLSEKWLSENFK